MTRMLLNQKHIVRYATNKRRKKMYDIKSLLIATLIVTTPFFFVEKSYPDTIKETYTEKDKQMIEEYLLYDKEKVTFDVEFLDYINEKIENGKDAQEIKNGFSMMYNLSSYHKIYFEDILINFLISELTSDKLSKDYMFYDRSIIRAMYALGLVHTDKSIDFLMTFIEPAENWPADLTTKIFNNADKDLIVYEIRYRMFGALLEPHDEKGKELLVVLGDRINELSDSDEMKQKYEERLERWKFFYTLTDEELEHYLQTRVKNFKQYR